MKKRYVYFDKKTRIIKDILSKRKRGRGYYIECDSNDVKDFIAGTKNIKEYIIVLDKKTEKYKFVKANYKLEIPEAKEIINVPYDIENEHMLQFIFKANKVLEIRLDKQKLNPLYGTDAEDKVVFDEWREYRVTLREKDTGELLIDIPFDLRELLREGSLTFKTHKHIYRNNLEIFASDIFEDVSWRGQRDRYVYYDEITGLISEISKNRDDTKKYIKCSIDEVVGFISGEKSISNYIIAYSYDKEKYIIMKKDNIIRLKRKNELIKIPYEANDKNDITIIYYSDNILEVSLDMSNISPLFQSDFKDEIKFESGTEFRLVLKEKDSGNLLVEYVIDCQELLEAGQMSFELYDHIYPDNVEMFTYPMFNTHSWYKGQVKLISPVKEKIKFDIQRSDHIPKYAGYEYHLVFEKCDQGLKIINNIDNLKLIRFNKQIEFFVVDKHDPNILYAKFALLEEDLKTKAIIVPLDCEIDGKSILYNNKYISVLLKKDKNDD